MDVKWQRLAGELLDQAADEFSNHGCNDWKWPDWLTKAERGEMARAMVADNVGKNMADLSAAELEEARDHARGEYGPPDFWVMRFLAHRLTA